MTTENTNQQIEKDLYENKKGFCPDCKKEVSVDFYNDKCTPPLMHCVECNQFVLPTDNVAYIKGAEQVVKYAATEEYLENLRLKYEFLPDVTTTKGYEDIKTGIAEIRSERGALEDERVSKKADALAFGRKVDAEATRIKGILLSIEEPMKEIRKKEDDRKEAIREAKKAAAQAKEDAINAKAEAIREIANDCDGKDSEYIAGRLAELETMVITEADFEHMTERAEVMRRKIVQIMKGRLATVQAQEQTAKEQAEIKAQQEKREAELKEREAVAEKARLEREAAEKVERDAQAETLRIQKEAQDKQAAELKAKQEVLDKQAADLQAEQDRIAAEAKVKAEEEAQKAVKAKAEAQRIANEKAEKKRLAAEKKDAKARYDVSKDEAITKLCKHVDEEKALAIFIDIESGNIPHIQFYA